MFGLGRGLRWGLGRCCTAESADTGKALGQGRGHDRDVVQSEHGHTGFHWIALVSAPSGYSQDIVQGDLANGSANANEHGCDRDGYGSWLTPAERMMKP